MLKNRKEAAEIYGLITSLTSLGEHMALAAQRGDRAALARCGRNMGQPLRRAQLPGAAPDHPRQFLPHSGVLAAAGAGVSGRLWDEMRVRAAAGAPGAADVFLLLGMRVPGSEKDQALPANRGRWPATATLTGRKGGTNMT